MKDEPRYRKRIAREAQRLLAELRPVAKRFTDVGVLEYARKPTFEGEHWVCLILHNSRVPEFFLALDPYSGGERFWFGFHTKSPKRMDEFVGLQDEMLKPKLTVKWKDWKKNKTALAHLGEQKLSRPFRENYGGAYYYGMYDWGGHGSQAGKTLDVHKAASFVAGALKNTGTKYPTKQDDPEYLGAIKIRLGQADFRKDLLSAYANKCAVTRCTVRQLLEAAHVKPYSDYGVSAESNGILLRSDIHTLFDRGLLKIHPDTREIWIHKSVKDPAYSQLRGEPLHEPESIGLRVSTKHLRARWKMKPLIGL